MDAIRLRFRSDLCLFLSASLRVPVLRSLRLSLTGRYRSTDLHYSHSFNVTVSYHISSKFGSIYLSISFSFASYPYALFTPAFADGAVQISLSISLHYRFPRGPDVAESQPPPPTHNYDTPLIAIPYRPPLLYGLLYLLSVSSFPYSTIPFARSITLALR